MADIHFFREEQRDPDGTIKLVAELRSDSRYTVITHNFCDRRTWYPESVRVTDETLVTTDPERKIWTSDHQDWIDLSHGRVSDEDDFSSEYLPIVTVDGDTMTEDEPFGDGGDGDISINYSSGVVTFAESVGEGDDPIASYSYANSSIFTIEPDEGKLIRLIGAECQMSSDIIMNDSLWYGVYITHPILGELLVKEKLYKTIQDFINEANGAYPVIPSIGGSKRGTPETTVTFPWHYISRTDLLSSIGMKIKIKLVNDEPCDGFGAYVAFYCVSMTEQT